jgi:hypothetical protein
MRFHLPKLVLPFGYLATLPFPVGYPDVWRQPTLPPRASANAGMHRRQASGTRKGACV